jgi:hypothetical protein
MKTIRRTGLATQSSQHNQDATSCGRVGHGISMDYERHAPLADRACQFLAERDPVACSPAEATGKMTSISHEALGCRRRTRRIKIAGALEKGRENRPKLGLDKNRTILRMPPTPNQGTKFCAVCFRPL